MWVLTGDKVETAMNIGMSCQLLNDEMNTFILREKKVKKILEDIAKCFSQQKVSYKGRENAVIVEGETLTIIQEDKQLTTDFIDLCENANVVIACRVSPKQKADVVSMVRERHPDKSTLSIGDGANDVNMIMRAHIGVGISGLEG